MLVVVSTFIVVVVFDIDSSIVFSFFSTTAVEPSKLIKSFLAFPTIFKFAALATSEAEGSALVETDVLVYEKLTFNE